MHGREYHYVAMKEEAEVRAKTKDDKEQQRRTEVTEVNKFQTQVSCCYSVLTIQVANDQDKTSPEESVSY